MKDHRASHSAGKMALTLGVSRSGYYAFLKRQPCKRDLENRFLVKQINEVHASSRGTYGSPRITDELKENGMRCSENRVARLMRDNGIKGRSKRKFKRTTNSRHRHPVAANVLAGNFNIQKPDRAWVSDITYIYTREGWLYLATVLDLYSRAIVGWSMSNRLKAELVMGSVFVTRKQARTEIFDYIEVFYNRKRKHSTLGNKAPFEFENQSTLN